MTDRVIFQPRAEQDMRDAARGIRDQSKSAPTALRWIRSIRARIDSLKTSPHRCPVDPDSDAWSGFLMSCIQLNPTHEPRDREPL